MYSSSLMEPQESFFKALVEQSTQGISIADLNGNYLYVNSTFCIMVGYSQSELLKMTVFDIKAPEQNPPVFVQTKKPKEKMTGRVILQRKDSSTFSAEIISTKVMINRQSCILGTVQDISDRIAIERSITKNESRNQMVMKIANDGIWDWHLDTDLMVFDERYYTMAGYEKDEFPYTIEEWQKRVHPDDIERATNRFQSYLKGNISNYDVEFRFLCKNNTYMWIRGKGKVVSRDKQRNPLRFIGTHSDITVQKEHKEKILIQAHFDSLTYLPNRFLSLDRLNIACNEAKRKQETIALLFLDLDDFKKINDSLGHETGDLLLIEAANRLRSVVRSVDTVGRLGGDEFIIILSSLKSAKEAHPIVENLLSQFRDLFIINNRELMLTATIGIAVYPNDAADASELLRNADSAMYDAKNSGRNTYSYYTAQMNLCAKRRITIEEQIHGALSRQEFSVYYQSKIDIKTSKIMGAEALLRWNNPALGHISPDEFIPIAEQTGTIIPLGEFVLQHALEQTAFWQNSFNSQFQIAVNLSPRQFRDPQLLSFIEKSLKNTSVSADQLELEITEGVLLSGHNYVDKVLMGIKRLGIKMAMDDFGTGYSSLSYLRKYPFDVLKIDRSFINDINKTVKSKALINAIISMSHALNLKVVAEGIETVQQYDQLQKFNCDYGQGYLFSKPVTAAKMTELLKEGCNSTSLINQG